MAWLQGSEAAGGDQSAVGARIRAAVHAACRPGRRDRGRSQRCRAARSRAGSRAPASPVGGYKRAPLSTCMPGRKASVRISGRLGAAGRASGSADLRVHPAAAGPSWARGVLAKFGNGFAGRRAPPTAGRRSRVWVEGVGGVVRWAGTVARAAGVFAGWWLGGAPGGCLRVSLERGGPGRDCGYRERRRRSRWLVDVLSWGG